VLNIAAFEMALEFSGSIRPHMASVVFYRDENSPNISERAARTLLIDRIFGTALLGSFTFAAKFSFASETAETSRVGSQVQPSSYLESFRHHPSAVLAECGCAD